MNIQEEMRLRYGRVHMEALGPMFPGARKRWLKRFFDITSYGDVVEKSVARQSREAIAVASRIYYEGYTVTEAFYDFGIGREWLRRYFILNEETGELGLDRERYSSWDPPPKDRAHRSSDPEAPNPRIYSKLDAPRRSGVMPCVDRWIPPLSPQGIPAERLQASQEEIWAQCWWHYLCKSKTEMNRTPFVIVPKNAVPEPCRMTGPSPAVLRKVAETSDVDTLKAADRQGRSSLSYAASAGSLSICRMLLTFRADPTQANSFGATPQSLAERQGHAEVTKLLAEVASTASKPAKKASDEAKGAKTAKWQTKKEEQGSQERQGAKVHPTGQIPEWRQSDEQTKEVKRLVQKWSSASFQQLMQECKMQRINTQDASHEDWTRMSYASACCSYMPGNECQMRSSSKAAFHEEFRFRSPASPRRCDVIFRLKEAVFGLRPGEFGPLPVAPADAASQVGQAADTPSAARPKAKPAAKATSPKAENQAGKPSDDSWKSDARAHFHCQEFPSFSGPAPGPDSVHWNDAELRQYFFSNGYLRPRSSRTATNTSAAPRELLRHFETLGLHPTASPEEVRRAYRGLALKHHPDKKADSSSTDFQRIQEAYDALSSRRPASRGIMQGDSGGMLGGCMGMPGMGMPGMASGMGMGMPPAGMGLPMGMNPCMGSMQGMPSMGMNPMMMMNPMMGMMMNPMGSNFSPAEARPHSPPPEEVIPLEDCAPNWSPSTAAIADCIFMPVHLPVGSTATRNN
eukprot:g9570.t1